MMKARDTARIRIRKNCIHFYLSDVYIGMMTYSGEVSDFRAVIRKKLKIPRDAQGTSNAIRESLAVIVPYYLTEGQYRTNTDSSEDVVHIMDVFEPHVRAASETIAEKGYVSP